MEDEKSLWGTGKTVITDSGFSVLKDLIGMYERGVYVSVVAKKRGLYIALKLIEYKRLVEFWAG